MQNATHFIEVYKSKGFGKLIHGSCLHLDHLKTSIAFTKSSPDLKTLFVWKIKEKPSAVIASHDGEVNATIIQPA